MPRKDYHNYSREKKPRHVPNWPEPTPEQLQLFHSHLWLGDTLTAKYWKKFHFDGYKGFYLEEIKQEVLLIVYKCALFFDEQRKVKFKSYVHQAVHNRLVNMVRDHETRMRNHVEVSLEAYFTDEEGYDFVNEIGIAETDFVEPKSIFQKTMIITSMRTKRKRWGA